MGTRYRLLGPTVLERGDAAVALPGRRAAVLLTVLLLHRDSVVARETLVASLWGDAPPPQAVTGLRVALTKLRRAIEPDRTAGTPSVLTHEGGGWRLAVPPGHLDTDRFEAAVAESRRALLDGDGAGSARWGRAGLAEWRGPALADVVDELDLARGPARRWEELRLEVLERTIGAELDLGAPESVVGELTGLVEAHPLHEPFVRLLMTALHRHGRQTAALRVYEAARRRLAEELGITPTEQLAQLERAILLGEPPERVTPAEPPAPTAGGMPAPRPPGPAAAVPAPPGPDPAAGSPGPGDPVPGRRPPHLVEDARRGGPLLGRDTELHRIDAVLRDVAAGRPATVVVSGPAGIGKTRLAAEIAATSHAGGAAVLFGRCDRDPLISYQPVVEALRDFIDEGGGPAAWSDGSAGAPSGEGIRGRAHALLDALSGRDGPGPSGAEADGTDRYRLFEAVVALLRALAADALTVVVIDDLHWADDGTVRLFHHLTRRLRDARVLLVATSRDTAGTPAAPGATPLLEPAGDGSVHRIALAGLGEDEAVTLVRREWSGGTDAAPGPTAARITALGEGNPFFLRHLARHAAAAGAADDASEGLPAEISTLVAALVAALDPPAQALAAAAAVQGRDFALDVVRAAAALDDDAAEAAVAQLTAAGLVVEGVSDDPDHHRFSHELVREATYTGLPRGRRARLHQRIGEALESSGAGTPFALAHHFYLAGPTQRGRAAHHAKRAGDHAMAALDFDVAVTHYQRARQLAAPSAGADGRDHIALLTALGRAHLVSGRADIGRRVIGEAWALARRDGAADLAARAALAYGGDWATADELLDSAHITMLRTAHRHLAGADTTLAARLTARLAATAHYAGDDRAAQAHSVDAVALARAGHDDSALAAALHVRHLVLGGGAPPAERLAVADEQLHVAVRGGTDVDQATAVWDRTIDVMELGRGDDVDAMVERYAAIAEAGRPPAPWWAQVLRATVATARGRLAEAEAHAFTALEIGQELAQPDTLRVFAGQLFFIRWWQGRLDELRDSVEGFVASAPEVPSWRAAHALLLAEAGDLTAAETALTGYVRVAAQSTGDLLGVAAPALAAEAAGIIGPAAAAPARYLFDQLRPFSGRHIVMWPGIALLGPADRYLAGLLAATGRRTEARVALATAAAMAERAGTVPFALLAQATAATWFAPVPPTGARPAPPVAAATVADRAADLGLSAVARRVAR